MKCRLFCTYVVAFLNIIVNIPFQCRYLALFVEYFNQYYNVNYTEHCVPGVGVYNWNILERDNHRK